MNATHCTFTLPIPPVTKKNHGNIVPTRGGKFRVVPSKNYKQYENAAGQYLPPLGIDSPINVKAIYYMKTHRTVDLCNLHAALHDAMVKWGVVMDDNSNVIVSTDGSCVRYDKDNPRTEIEITPMVRPILAGSFTVDASDISQEAIDILLGRNEDIHAPFEFAGDIGRVAIDCANVLSAFCRSRYSPECKTEGEYLVFEPCICPFYIDSANSFCKLSDGDTIPCAWDLQGK